MKRITSLDIIYVITEKQQYIPKARIILFHYRLTPVFLWYNILQIYCGLFYARVLV